MLGLDKGSQPRTGTSLERKLQVLRDKLEQMNEKTGSEGMNEDGMADVIDKKPQTVGDDGTYTVEQQKRIAEDEALIRPVLALFGIPYDDLIQLQADGITSPYEKAIQANPALLQQVLQSERPVLAALQVAVGFKPYAEFMDKYGADPQSIRTAIREEMKQELAAPVQQAEEQAKKPLATPFSRSGRQMAAKGKSTAPIPLGDIFKRQGK
ncbi:MAG: hypothetical protein OXR68_04260 [Alphaproteobacteria bacterium]|nr:hypothetical protein [Alphaproteobacteria bacterium]MDD9919821.1 hypothetical protein [Alphaproteobacteria bacterium]